jgi:hypothetical protein
MIAVAEGLDGDGTMVAFPVFSLILLHCNATQRDVFGARTKEPHTDWLQFACVILNFEVALPNVYPALHLMVTVSP